jgi:integrating conjugative element relaxase (TIGR03760 family)
VSIIHHLFDLISRRLQQKTRPFNGFYPVLSALELLEPHRQLVDKIRQYCGVPETVWASTHEQLLHNFARRVQLLPASETDHHTEPGGLLAYALETVDRAMKIRRGYLLPNGASSECISEQQEVWNFVVLCAALLHDIGKPITAVRISLRDREGRALLCSLACDDLPAGASYRPEFCRGQQEQHHQSIPLLIAGQIIPKTALQWLSQYPDVFNLWLLTLSGRYTEAGMLGEIITRADQYATPKSLSQNIGNQRLHAEAESEPHPSDQPVATSRRAKEKQAGQVFLQWLRQQIVDYNIGINTDNAHLHTVKEGLLIVSPAIFRRYLRSVDHLELEELQRGFQSLGVHRMMASNQPIWTYRQQGKKRNSKLRGMLIADPLTVLDLDDLPEANPLVTVETSRAGDNSDS